MKLATLTGLLGVATALVVGGGCVGDDPATGPNNTSSDGSTSDGNTSTGGDGGGDGSTPSGDGSVTGDAGSDAAPPPHVSAVDAYFKASNTRASAEFGNSVAMSSDGLTLVIASSQETSGATGVNNTSPGQGDTSKSAAGAVYVFTKSGTTWTQVAYIKPSNTAVNENFGISVALSSDGSRLIVGARGDSTTQVGSGAVFFFTRNGSGVTQTWSQTGGVFKASNIQASAQFGVAVAMSGDGNTAAVGAIDETASDTGVSTGAGGAANGSYSFAGAAYIFGYSGGNWAQTEYVKPSNTQVGGRFGWSVALSNDGSELAVGSEGEASGATGVGINSTDMSATFAGATYIFSKAAGIWSQTAYIKSSNTRANALFGNSVALGGVGGTVLAVGSSGESSGATGVNNTTPGQGDTSANDSGAVYVFTRAGSTWSQQAYVKSSNTRGSAGFGKSVALSIDGNSLIAGSTGETSAAINVNDTSPGQDDTSTSNAGAAYVFALVGGTWEQTAYLKSSFAHADNFGCSAAITNNAAAVAVGGETEPSSATGVNGDATNSGASGSGAAFTFK